CFQMPSFKKILFYTFSFSVIAIAFLLPAFPRTTGFFIALLTITWMVDGKLLSKIRIISRQPLALLFVAVYVMWLLWIIPSSNIRVGAEVLLLKVSLLLFPIIFFAPGNLAVPPVRMILQFFILGCILCSAILLTVASFTYFSNGENHFTYTNLTEPLAIHPAFISLYLVFCIFSLLLPFLERKKSHLFGSGMISALLLLFFIMMIFLLSARQEMIALVLLLPASLLYYFFRKKQLITGIAISTGLIAALLIVIFFVPEAKMRMEKMQSQMEESYTNAAPNSVTMRKVIWQSAGEIIRQHPWGVGTGDVNDALRGKYREKNLLWPLNDNLNAHNQYLQITIATGIPGLLIFILSIVAALKMAIKKRHYSYLLFLVLFLFCIITECMLETEAGVVFFSFFNSLLAREAVNAPG
ncbi:MAG TPA: O-antigen ligase family protein, partial [Chitinophagales bacterium]|nr:O-antigen ligase family protein [Chitinophagales bacterium]